ncbi:VWA domain-containing protein [Mangrovibacterium lignilyticum]|uniref:VWA domain-containing protein n=1 Tax=Mangrovibacterium lignilyticum TaxID=2668052 RepID=UPI001966D2AA|nr:VWA domain-containing protein [Mangrovibacterium lignilyticum]
MGESFEFAYQWVLYLFPLPLLMIYLFPPMRVRKTALRAPFFMHAVAAGGDKPNPSVRQLKRPWLRSLIVWISWALILTAVARPQLVGEPEQKIKTTRNMLIVADLSFSMVQKDWTLNSEAVSRWDAVKHLLADFIAERKSDRIGAVLFGSNAYTLAPFTSDLSSLQLMLDDTGVGMAGQQTNIGRAIGKGIELFDNDTLPQRVMLLITDGSDSGIGMSPTDAAVLAQQDSITIHTIGIGDPAKPGSDLDEEMLQNISELTGGQYFLAMDSEAMSRVYETLDELEPIDYEVETYTPVEELYYYPLIAVILLSMVFQYTMGIIRLLKSLAQAAGKNVTRPNPADEFKTERI